MSVMVGGSVRRCIGAHGRRLVTIECLRLREKGPQLTEIPKQTLKERFAELLPGKIEEIKALRKYVNLNT